MNFELWARSRFTKNFSRLYAFDDERQFCFYVDQVDRDQYSEVIINDRTGSCVYYREFKKDDIKTLRREK
jgi:hypothetical protein